MESLDRILHFDPYMYLNSETLEMLFGPMSQAQELSESLLLDFSENYPNDADKFQEILLDNSRYNWWAHLLYNIMECWWLISLFQVSLFSW